MKSEKLQAQAKALEWYATMEIDADFAPKGYVQEKTLKSQAQEPESSSMPSNPYINSTTDQISMPIKPLAANIQTKFSDITELRQAVLTFEGCLLKSAAANTVFADGVPTSKIMLIGEAPGATEDAKGIPFCGESGKLLDSMIGTIGLSREKNVYITNTIFWRPPGNRAPTDQEIETCRPFVEQHIALISPSLLVLVGSTAVTSLLGKHLQISRIRQEYYQYTNKYLDKSIATTALFHPAYLLRQPMQKKTTWYDLLKIKEFIGKNIKDIVF